MKKKGVSPLIATVLLVAFSIALGAIVMNFTETSTQEYADKAELAIDRNLRCPFDLSIRIIEINNEKQLYCNRTGDEKFEIFLENLGDEDAAGIQLVILDNESKSFSYNELKTILGHDSQKFNFTLGTNFIFPPVKLLVTPLLEAEENKLIACHDNQIDLEEEEIGC